MIYINGKKILQKSVEIIEGSDILFIIIQVLK